MSSLSPRAKVVVLAGAALLLIIASTALRPNAPSTAEAQTAGAAIVSVDTPSVSGGNASFSGSVDAGLAKCGTAQCQGGVGPICNCCNIPPIECSQVPWQSCLVTGITYSITGPAPRSGSASVTNTSVSPSGCTSSCSLDGNQCHQSQSYGFSESNLPSGTYTVTVTSQDCKGANSSQRQFTISNDAVLGCSVSPAQGRVGESVTFSATGGNNSYSWTASGGNPSSGTVKNFSTSYASTGTKTAKVTSGTQTKNCSVSIEENPNLPATGNHVSNDAASCTVNGYAYDPDNASPLTPVSVKIFSDGSLVKTVTANLAAGSGVTCTQGNCRFAANLSGLISPAATHSITAKVVDLQTGEFNLTGTPKDLTCTPSCGAADGLCPAGCANPPDSDCAVPPPPPASFDCTPKTQNTQTGQGVSLFVTGSAPSYSWSAPGGSPANGSASQFTTAYDSTGDKTVTLSSGGISKTCSVTVNPAPITNPFVDLRINGTDGPATIFPGGGVFLTWGSSNAATCFATNSNNSAEGWYNYRSLSGGEQISGIQNTITYTLRCTSGGKSASDSVTAIVSPECSPAGQTAAPGQTVTLTASGGNGGYSWSAAGGNPSSGNQASFATSFAATGTKSVMLTSEGVSDTCTVTVSDPAAPAATGTVRVLSNLATTWTLSGPPGGGKTQSSSSTGATYNDSPTGNYTVSPASLPGYGTPQIAAAQSQNLFAGQTLTFSLTYTEGGMGGAGVDLRANGSNTPPSIPVGTSALLSWTSNNVQPGSCAASGGWSGTKANSGSENSAPLVAQTTFNIQCTSTGGVAVTDAITVGVRPPRCSDAADNDGDAKIDHPVDPGCASPSDDDESNTLPQCSDGIDNADTEDSVADANDPGCWTDPAKPSTYVASDNDETDGALAECSDGFDNDGDGNVDYPADDGCSSGSDQGEQKEPDIREI